jgi:hypothetical protein
MCKQKNIKGANGITWTVATCFWGNIWIWYGYLTFIITIKSRFLNVYFLKNQASLALWFLIYLKNWVGPIFRNLTNNGYEVGAMVWLNDWLGTRPRFL